jgi:NitT/TauT family transport system substrate-binding protein
MHKLGFLLSIAFLSTAHMAMAADTVRMATFTWFGYGPVFVAQEKDFFGDLNVEVKVIDDVTARYAAYQSGEFDIMPTTIDGAAIESTQGIDGKLFMMTDDSRGADGIIAKADIKTAQDLKGKTIAFPRGVASHFLLHTVLKNAGLGLGDIQPKILDDASMAAQAFMSGQVDAAVTWEPYISQVGSKGHVLVTTKDMPESLPGTLWGSQKFVNNTANVQKFIIGWQKAIQFAKNNPAEANAIMAKGFGLKPAEIADGLTGLVFTQKTFNHAYLCGSTPKVAPKFDDAGKLWLAEKVIDKAPPSSQDIISNVVCNIN